MFKRGIHIAFLLFSFSMLSQEVKFTKVVTDSIVSFNLVNNSFAPVTLSVIKVSELNISIPNQDIVCESKDSLVDIIKIPKRYIDNDSSFKASNHFKASVVFGKKVESDSLNDVMYELPFTNGKKYKVLQGFKGKFTHNSNQSRFAIDFKIPIGDTIVASRNGIVIRAISHFTKRGGKAYRDKSNQILIYHDDGTIAYYVHLDTNGTLVNVGDYVNAGEPIGISGFTGYTTKPHLHFVVRNLDMAIPIQFKEKNNIGRKSGEWAEKPKQ